MKKFTNKFTNEEFIGLATDRYISYQLTKYGIECFTIEDIQEVVRAVPRKQIKKVKGK